MGDTGGRGPSTRSTWALPVGLVLLTLGVVLAVVLPNDEATTSTGVFVAVAVAGLVLTVSGIFERNR